VFHTSQLAQSSWHACEHHSPVVHRQMAVLAGRGCVTVAVAEVVVAVNVAVVAVAVVVQ